MRGSDKSWLDALLPFPRPEYAKQTEALLTDLLWRSEGSTLAEESFFEKLGQLRQTANRSVGPDPERLIPRKRHASSTRLFESFPLAESSDLTDAILGGPDLPTKSLLNSVLAPRARGDKADACVPIHPSLVSLQTLHGLVNKENPANLASAMEVMGWLGGSPVPGSVASSFLSLFSDKAGLRDGLTGLMESIFPRVAAHVWASLPKQFAADSETWPVWPEVEPVTKTPSSPSLLNAYFRTPFSWFWKKWSVLCSVQNGWHKNLPTRRFVDWAMCLLRTGLAFSYLWEAEFFCRLYDCILAQKQSSGVIAMARLRSLLNEGAVLGVFEPASVPASQKGIWQSTSELLARGYEARKRILEFLDGDINQPSGSTFLEVLDSWVASLAPMALEELSSPLQTQPRTANNQKEFVKYLLLPRSSDDDAVDQADFYHLARTNSRHVWFYPGPEWLVVLTSLLGRVPGGECTLGMVVEDLASLGIRVERSVLVALLEEAGLTTDSPDADNAVVIRSGF